MCERDTEKYGSIKVYRHTGGHANYRKIVLEDKRDATHVLSLLDVEQVFALHGLFQQGPVLQHEGLDLIQQMPVLFL